MPRRKNEVLIKWMDRLCKGEQNHVSLKHIHKPTQMISPSWNGRCLRRPNKGGRQRRKGETKVGINARLYNIIHCSYIRILMIIHTYNITCLHAYACVRTQGLGALLIITTVCCYRGPPRYYFGCGQSRQTRGAAFTEELKQRRICAHVT